MVRTLSVCNSCSTVMDKEPEMNEVEDLQGETKEVSQVYCPSCEGKEGAYTIELAESSFTVGEYK